MELEVSVEKVNDGQTLKGKNLLEEVRKRLDKLGAKYDLSSLRDYLILDLSQDKNLDLEFNTILEKVMGLSSLVTRDRMEVEKFLNIAIEKRVSVSESCQNSAGIE